MTRQQPLVVDLDGSLLNTDTLHELLIKFLKHHPFKIFLLMIWLIKGKAALKDKLTQYTDINVAQLPYNDALIEWLKTEKRTGRKLVLATGASKNTANHVARHLNIFDDVHASDASFNCSGKKKRDLLVTEYGDKGYDYVGNSPHDLSVWRSAHKAILVNTSKTTRKRAHKTTDIEKEFSKPHSELFALLKAVRPHQALKNLLLLIPLFTAHQMADMSALFHLLLGFISFSFCAFSIYLVNDLLDLEHDRLHPRKKYRPLASGKLSIQNAILAVPTLLCAGLALAWMINIPFFSIMLTYIFLTTLYSFCLKSYVLIDCLVLAGLYTIRVIAGAAATGIALSFWLLLFSVFIFISLAFIKRYTELEALGYDSKDTLKGRGYLASDLHLIREFGVISGYLSALVLALYINSENVVVLYKTPEILWLSIPLMLFWISRAWLKAHRGQMHDDPVVFALTDKISLLTGLLFVVIFSIAAVMGRV